MSGLADHFDECDDCGGYVLAGVYGQIGSRLSTRCRCDDLPALSDSPADDEGLTVVNSDPLKDAA